MSEKNIQSMIMIGLSQAGVTIFRNHTGQGVTGQVTTGSKPGHFIVTHGRRTSFGLAPGSSDLIGWRSVVITPDMVGKRTAVFCAVEVKTATGRPTPEQVSFIEAVRRAGGIAGIVRSVDEAVGLCYPLGLE